MRKRAKVIAITSAVMLVVVGTSMYVIDINKEVLKPIRIAETDSYDEIDIDAIVADESSLAGLDTTIEIVQTETPANEINIVTGEVIESDEETGAQTIVNTDGDVVVTNDEALAIAEANSGADDILKNIMADYVTEDNNAEEKADKADIKVDKPVVKKNDEELKKVYSSETTETKENDVEIDEATKDLFAEMGWRTDAAEHQTDMEGGVWTIQEGKTKGNPFYTP